MKENSVNCIYTDGFRVVYYNNNTRGVIFPLLLPASGKWY